MNYYFLVIFGVLYFKSINCQPPCNILCPEEERLICGFDIKHVLYKMFPGKCSLSVYSECHNTNFVQTPLKYCLKQDFNVKSRKMIGDEESCPVFCPSHYSPVCGASSTKSYVYRTFTNGCYLDILNCRGDEFADSYVEVPLSYCQRHAMKNIFKEKVFFHDAMDYRDY